ncbi:18 kDa heat shock protein [Planctomycetes bacterium Poly30]|uniref:18 kDa heat shock protein n=1 Tax=Saltatorellus ferox TaxID=2528018 RepID=A0A518EVA6_9BACT|nr:18 kDa heat shock protein [Planctomycetes bacterium Poly30]
MVRFENHPLSLLSGQGINGLFRVAENLHAQMAQADPSMASPVRTAAPRAELKADEEAATLVMLIPGFGPDHVDISVERASVTVRGEREGGPAGDRFERQFKLPFPVDADRASASVEFGVLTLELPRLSADKPRRIAVQGASQPAVEASAKADSEPEADES